MEKPLDMRVKVPTMRYEPHLDGGQGIVCDCGAKKQHNRAKVLIKWIERHTQKTGHRFETKK